MGVCWVTVAVARGMGVAERALVRERVEVAKGVEGWAVEEVVVVVAMATAVVEARETGGVAAREGDGKVAQWVVARAVAVG